MKSELIAKLETFGYPVFLQGSLDTDEQYPDSFFTFWNFETPEGEFYDDKPHRAVWGFWVYFYSVNPQLVEEKTEAARILLKANGWIPNGKPNDISVDVPTHTGSMFEIFGIEKYKEESTNG